MFTLRPLATTLALAAVLAMAGCNNLTFPQRENPAKAFKEYRPENANQSAVIGVGDPISTRQAAANATLTMSGSYDLSSVLQRVAGTYNLAVRWGSGVRRDKRADVVLNSLTFDEARNYIEDVYGIQIIKEGERRLLVLPSASEPRLTEFAPGTNVTLAEALRGLADQCNYNLIVNENRDQLASIKVSTKLKDITCQDAFDALLNPQGLSLVNSGDYVTVGGLPQRQWSVNLFEPVRSEEVSVNYSSNFGADSGGSGGDTGGSSGSMTSGGASKVSIKYERDLWKDMESDLQKLIDNNCVRPLTAEAASQSGVSSADLLLPPTDGSTPTPDASVVQNTSAPAMPSESATSTSESGSTDTSRCGYVRVNTAVGTVQMRAARSVLDQADDIIRRTESIANRRLLLEARVMAVTRDRGYEQKGGFAQGRANSDGNSIAFGSPGSIASTLSRSLANFGTNAAGTSLPGFSFKNANLDAVVSFMEKYSTTYQLMHPVMELMDRQRATLIDGTNQKYFVVETTITGSGTDITQTADVEERNQFLGLQFSAAAQISDDPSEPHTISLQIPITSKTGEINIPTGISGTIAGVAPIANTRLIDQKVRIRDGEIKAIGGLTMTIATDKESGMPVLRDIPIMGKLANDENIDYQQVEFVILLQVKRLN